MQQATVPSYVSGCHGGPLIGQTIGQHFDQTVARRRRDVPDEADVKLVLGFMSSVHLRLTRQRQPADAIDPMSAEHLDAIALRRKDVLDPRSAAQEALRIEDF